MYEHYNCVGVGCRGGGGDGVGDGGSGGVFGGVGGVGGRVLLMTNCWRQQW